MKPDNELLGYWKCRNGSRAEVRQTKKAGRHFYTNCGRECCGLQQGTGAIFQQDVYDNAEFIPGVTVVRPSNVVESVAPVGEPEPVKPALSSDPEPKAQAEPVGDFDPTASEQVSEEKPVKSGLSRLIPGVVLLVAAGVGAWMA